MEMNSTYQPRPLMEIIDEVRAKVIKERGKLYTEEEVIKMVNKAKAELHKEGKI